MVNSHLQMYKSEELLYEPPSFAEYRFDDGFADLSFKTGTRGRYASGAGNLLLHLRHSQSPLPRES